MKTLVSAILAASVFIIPSMSFAQQTNEPVTRAQVRAQLGAAEQEGFLHQSNSQYPKTVPASPKAAGAFDISGYGPAVGGSSEAATTTDGMRHLLYSHH